MIDYFARLDGIDFRQTAPVKPGQPFLRPFGLEWEASEGVLTQPLPGIKPTMIARAGGLDQGNICMNLVDTARRGSTSDVLFLAGSAINSIKDAKGKANPKIGAEAMQQAIEIHRSGNVARFAAGESAGGNLGNRPAEKLAIARSGDSSNAIRSWSLERQNRNAAADRQSWAAGRSPRSPTSTLAAKSATPSCTRFATRPKTCSPKWPPSTARG